MTRAVAVRPDTADSLDLVELPDPVAGPGELLVDGLAVGICGTDREILAGEHGSPPEGEERLILGHESLGRVSTAPEGSGFAPGDLVVGIVRRPDPAPCGACAHGEYDMCRNGEYTERGIAGRHGYAATSWTVEAQFAVAVAAELGDLGVLFEPTSVVAKAWEQIQAVGERAWFEPQTVLVTGSGPIGLLAALLGTQRGLQVHVLDRGRDGVKPDLVHRLGAHHHSDTVEQVAKHIRPDIVIEATGAPSVIVDCLSATGPYGIVCLTGVSAGGRRIEFDAGAVNRDLVLGNNAIVGSVTANRRHYDAAAQALAAADPSWLGALITRRVPLSQWRSAYTQQPGDVKVVLDLTE